MENKIRTDKQGNTIGDGTFQVDYFIFDIENTTIDVQNSETTETVYVTYTSNLTGMSCKVRFSNHESNAVKFGDVLDGYWCDKQQVMYRLGLLKRTFIPETYLSIGSRQVSKRDFDRYEVAELTIQEMYNLGEGGDLTKYVGKLAKNSNYLILDNTVNKFNRITNNAFGFQVEVGKYIYHN